MNIFLYGGTSRFNATEQVVSSNEAAEINTNYTISFTSGMLLVAFPNEDQDGAHFEFEYWLDGYSPSWFEVLEAELKEYGISPFWATTGLIIIVSLVGYLAYYCKKHHNIKDT